MTITEARTKFKIKQVQLAQMCQLTAVELCRIEKGQVTPHPSTILRIEYALGMHIDWEKMKNNNSMRRTIFNRIITNK